MPYLNAVFGKFASRGFSLLAVNVLSDPDQEVLSYFRDNKYDFPSLKCKLEWAEKTLSIRNMPSNLLVDQRGKTVFRPVVHDAQSQRSLELMVEALLSREAKI